MRRSITSESQGQLRKLKSEFGGKVIARWLGLCYGTFRKLERGEVVGGISAKVCEMRLGDLEEDPPFPSERVSGGPRAKTLESLERIRRFQGGDDRAATELLLEYGPRVDGYMRRFRRSCGDEWDDVRQEARIAILEGCRRFDPAFGTKPINYIWYFVRGEISKFWQRDATLLPRKKAVIEFLEEDGDELTYIGPGPEEELAELEVGTKSAWLVSNLMNVLEKHRGARNRMMVQQRYFNEPEMTLGEIGDLVFISRERVRGIIEESLRRFRYECPSRATTFAWDSQWGTEGFTAWLLHALDGEHGLKPATPLKPVVLSKQDIARAAEVAEIRSVAVKKAAATYAATKRADEASHRRAKKREKLHQVSSLELMKLHTDWFVEVAREFRVQSNLDPLSLESEENIRRFFLEQYNKTVYHGDYFRGYLPRGTGICVRSTSGVRAYLTLDTGSFGYVIRFEGEHRPFMSLPEGSASWEAVRALQAAFLFLKEKGSNA